jgi:hypothetical protein
MTCQSTVEGRQSEFDFFRQMIETPEMFECCGPLTTIGFTRPSMSTFHSAIAKMGLVEGHLDSYDPKMLDSSHMSLTMCPKHWILHARGVGKLAEDEDSEILAHLAYYLFRVTCLTNEWDYKEILNYAKTAGSIKPN